MESKLDKLKEIGELLHSGAITHEEFEKLKSEILNEGDAPQKEKPSKQFNDGYEKILLKSFLDDNDKLVKAPDIEYINFKDISNEERTVLRTFLRKKQISAPEEMSQDEIDLGNKLFTDAEIVKMNSERKGFNYPWSSILGLVAVGVATIFIYISPCFVILGAGTALAYGAINAGWILTRSDATKMDKRVSAIALILSILVFLFIDRIQDIKKKLESNSEKIESFKNTKSYDDDFSSTCSRCKGTGVVATYSGITCDASHFDYGDCFGGHKSGYTCPSTGSKTCPCCNGK